MASPRFVDCELFLSGQNQARLSATGRDYSGRPTLDATRMRWLLEVELEPVRYGRLLFEALFPEGDDLLAGYRDSLAIARHEGKRLRLRLHVASAAPPELHDLHWELLYDPRQKIALGRSQETAFSRYLGVPFEPSKTVAGRPRLLVALACPRDLADYGLPDIGRDAMRQALERALSPLAELMTWEFLEGPATIQRIRDQLIAGDFHGLHLAAHGLQSSEESVARLVLEGADGGAHFVNEELFAEIFAGHQDLRLVTLIACHGGAPAGQDPFSGLAPSLVRQGVPAVIAMRRQVSLEGAARFAEHFYRNLARRGQIDAAANESRLQLYLADSEHYEWGMPALFMRLSEGRLWRSEPAAASPAVRPPSSKKSFESPPLRLRLRHFPEPALPDRPYPVLLPYTHPALLGGRERDLAGLRGRLRQPTPILGLCAPSGAGKSSVLLGGLLPALRTRGQPASLDRHPHEPGIARRILGDLLEEEGANLGDHEHELFVDRLVAVEKLAGEPPVMVLDQLEDVLRRPDAGAARAALGVLLAASVRRRPGRSAPPCRWLLAYRQEVHGEVMAWLGDVLAGARERRLEGIEGLPHDLATADRFHVQPLANLGAPLPGADPLTTATQAFLAAIEAPLTLRDENDTPKYPWHFAPGCAERLARAFAEVRLARPEAPLTPELQVVLAHVLAGAGDEGIVDVPDDPGPLIDRALEQHLERALENAFPTGRSPAELAGARLGRARALLALRELATTTGRRDEGLSANQLARAIGRSGERFDGLQVLEQLASPLTRLVVAWDAPDGLRYVLSHDRMAEAVVRLVEAEGQRGRLLVDADLVRLRRLVALETALHGLGEAPPRLPRRHFQRIAANAEALLWDDEHRAWWSACRQRRRADRRRTAGMWLVSLIWLALLSFVVWSVSTTQNERQELRNRVVQGEPEVAFQALDQLRRSGEGDRDLLSLLGQREIPSDVLERGLDGLEGEARSAAVLATVELLLPWVRQTTDDQTRYNPVLFANLVWALDFGPARDPHFASRARRLRERVLQRPLWPRPPPPRPGPGDPDWIEIPTGDFLMGGIEKDGAKPDERSRHWVAVAAFRLLRHEVTQAEYRRLVPGHPGHDALPVRDVSWYEAVTYAAWLGGRLPTEAEWEYAARAGCEHHYCDLQGRAVNAEAVAWTQRNSWDSEVGKFVRRPVMTLSANPWGLYDMLGNLWEWTSDWYGPYPDTSRGVAWAPTGRAATGGGRVVRGGCFQLVADSPWASTRHRFAPHVRGESHGFRVVLPVDRSPSLEVAGRGL